MKYLTTIGLVLLLAVVAVGQTAEQKSPGSRTIEKLTSQKIDFTIPEVGGEVQRVQLNNGLVVYLYENHRVPLVNVYTTVRCGSVYDSPDKASLSSLTGTVLRTGGSKNVSGDSLNMVLEFIGGSLETGIGDESGYASLNILSKDLDLGLQLYADLLRNPSFPEDKLELAKADIRNAIKRRNDDPGTITNRYFNNILYGEHPSGRILEWATVKAIIPADLAAYHQKFYVPNNIIIGIAGDFNRDALLGKLEQYFGDWQKSETPLAPPPEVSYAFKPGVYQVVKDINQANLRIGHLGIRRDNPDRYAVALMNYVLGGGSFTSRLTEKVRSDAGLAYSAGSGYETSSRDYGAFYAYCQTKSESANRATRIIFDEINRIRTEGVTAKELDDAKGAYINRFVFTWDSPGKIVQNYMSLEYDGLPADYYKEYINNYRKVTRDDIKAVAQKYLNPEQLTFLVVGNPATFDKPMDEFGPVTTIELTDPVLE